MSSFEVSDPTAVITDIPAVPDPTPPFPSPPPPTPTLPPITLPDPSPSVGQRFYKAPNWRFVVSDLDSVSVTFLDRIASDRILEFDLNTPTSIAGLVPSTEPEISILHTDGDPFLSEGNRLLYAFRREGPVGQPWVIRAAGIIMEVEDDGEQEVARTKFTAFDP